MEKSEQDAYDELLSQLVIRMTAMEMILVQKNILSQEEVSDATLTVMSKLQAALEDTKTNLSEEEFNKIEVTAKPSTGFIKHGAEPYKEQI